MPRIDLLARFMLEHMQLCVLYALSECVNYCEWVFVIMPPPRTCSAFFGYGSLGIAGVATQSLTFAVIKLYQP